MFASGNGSRVLTDGDAKLLSIRIAHIGEHSGYHCLTRYVGEPITIGGTRWASGRLSRWLTVGLCTLARVPWYSPGSFALEVRGGATMLSSRGLIYHVLQADNDLWLTPLLATLTKNRVIGTVHQPPSEIERAGGPWANWSRLDKIVTVSRHQAAYLQSVLPGSQVEFVPHGVDTDFFTPPPDRAPTLDRAKILCVGKHLRDFDVLERVVMQLSRRAAGCRFTLIGLPANLVNRFRQLGATCPVGLSDHDLRDAYRSADIMVLPLKESTANNALLEAMACGLPTVVSAVGGVLDYVVAGSAVLVPAGDAAAMSEAVVDLLENGSQYRSISLLARQQAMRFRWEDVGEQMRDLYASV